MDEIKVPMAKPVFEKEESDGVIKILNSGWLGQGKITEEFENNLSDYFSSKVTAINSGSSAIMCALLALGIKPGDKIVVPNFTFISTSSVPKILGAKIIPVDIDLKTLNTDIDSLKEILQKNDVKAVIFVDIAGLPNDIDLLVALSKKYNFILIEDAAEAFGSEYKNKKLGSFDHTSIFSFHIAKAITTIEGGCITTTNQEVIDKTKAIRDVGRYHKGYIHELIGSNFRITDIQSSIGINQLKKSEQFISKRIEIAKRFKSEIKNLEFQNIPNYVSRHSYMLFFGLTDNSKVRDEYVKKLRDVGIDARLSFYPISDQPCNPELNQYECQNSKEIYKKAFTLPLYNSLKDSEIQLIINTCNSF
jgi:perosamine synthetase